VDSLSNYAVYYGKAPRRGKWQAIKLYAFLNKGRWLRRTVFLTFFAVRALFAGATLLETFSGVLTLLFPPLVYVDAVDAGPAVVGLIIVMFYWRRRKELFATLREYRDPSIVEDPRLTELAYREGAIRHPVPRTAPREVSRRDRPREQLGRRDQRGWDPGDDYPPPRGNQSQRAYREDTVSYQERPYAEQRPRPRGTDYDPPDQEDHRRFGDRPTAGSDRPRSRRGAQFQLDPSQYDTRSDDSYPGQLPPSPPPRRRRGSRLNPDR
jgi:hypothetical protein